jgi:hypothetical protein
MQEVKEMELIFIVKKITSSLETSWPKKSSLIVIDYLANLYINMV